MDLTSSPHPTTPAYISLGSNQGESKAILRAAIERFSAEGDATAPLFRLGPCSSLYVTEPQLYAEQPFFTNQIVRLDCFTSCSAFVLLDYLQGLEQELGRVRTGERYGPRIIDLDIVLFGQEQITSNLLTIPHARMYERAFVLVPLAEIAPDLRMPDGRSLDSILKAISYTVVDNLILQPSPDVLTE